MSLIRKNADIKNVTCLLINHSVTFGHAIQANFCAIVFVTFFGLKTLMYMYTYCNCTVRHHFSLISLAVTYFQHTAANHHSDVHISLNLQLTNEEAKQHTHNGRQQWTNLFYVQLFTVCYTSCMQKSGKGYEPPAAVNIANRWHCDKFTVTTKQLLPVFV